MTISDQVLKNIVCRVIESKDYRIEIVNLLNASFLQFAVDFFKKVVDAKLNDKHITIEWYKSVFLDSRLPSDEIAINSGLNKKTISNMYRSARKQIVIDASNEHFDTLYRCIQDLVESEPNIDLTLTIKFNNVSVDLNISESLVVINTLAVKRAALRGGYWSTAGKRAEKYLMLALCRLYNVSEDNYNSEHFVRNRALDVDREIDFYLKNDGNEYKCEVKLMGQGNPESADVIYARDTRVFVADTLSDQNKSQFDNAGVYWVALRDENGYQRFESVLHNLNIPYTSYHGNLDEDLPNIMNALL